MELDYISALPGTGKTKWAVAKVSAWMVSPDGYFMYVAPSVALLKEVARYLKKSVPKEHHSKIELIYSKKNEATVTSRLTTKLRGLQTKFGQTPQSPIGTVFLITHEAFLRLPRIPNSHKIHLIFDEARKCITQPYTMSVPDDIRQTFLSLFHLEAIDSNLMLATPKEPKKVVKKVLTNLDLKPKPLSHLVKLSSSIQNPRLEVFFSRTTHANFTFEVILPSALFNGFRTVTLMSAFFEDSQMFHLLKKKGVQMTNITEVALQSYEHHTKKILNRYSKIDLAVLAPNEKSVLSKTKLEGVLVSVKHEEQALDALNALGINSRTELEILKDSLKNPTFSGTPEVEDFRRTWAQHLDIIQMDPIKWLIKDSVRVIREWSTTNKIKEKPLMVLNAESKTLFTDKLSSFHVETTNLHGLNQYLNQNVVVFLAAVNPAKRLIYFYSKYLPDYDQAKDHVAEVCVQCVCRISIRNTKATERTLVVVPDLGIARLLMTKLQGLPSVRKDLTSSLKMTFVVLSGKTRVRRKAKRHTSTARSVEWRKDPVNLVLAKLRAKRSYYKAKETAAGKQEYSHLVEVISNIEQTRKIPDEYKHLSTTTRKSKKYL